MARPQRNNIDYFPFYCEEGKKMYYLEEMYGNDGFAVFVKILRELAKTDYHYLDLSKNTTLMFLSAKCKVTKDVLNSIISDLVDLEKFDKMLWEENRIIWCQDFIDSIQDAYKKRSNDCIDRKGLECHLVGLGVRKLTKSSTKRQKQDSKASVNTQSIEDYNKEDNINIDFDVFWDAYNKKVGHKDKIKKQWNALKDEDRTAIIEHLPKYIASTPEKQYRKNASTYLNNKSWNDEIIGEEQKREVIVAPGYTPPKGDLKYF